MIFPSWMYLLSTGILLLKGAECFCDSHYKYFSPILDSSFKVRLCWDYDEVKVNVTMEALGDAGWLAVGFRDMDAPLDTVIDAVYGKYADGVVVVDAHLNPQCDFPQECADTLLLASTVKAGVQNAITDDIQNILSYSISLVNDGAR